MTNDYLFNELKTDVLAGGGSFAYKNLHELKLQQPEVVTAMQAETVRCEGTLPYHGTGYSLKSTCCSQSSIKVSLEITGSPCCPACLLLMLDKTLQRRSDYLANQPDSELSKYARHDIVGSLEDAVTRLRSSIETIQRLFKEKEVERRQK